MCSALQCLGICVQHITHYRPSNSTWAHHSQNSDIRLVCGHKILFCRNHSLNSVCVAEICAICRVLFVQRQVVFVLLTPQCFVVFMNARISIGLSRFFRGCSTSSRCRCSDQERFRTWRTIAWPSCWKRCSRLWRFCFLSKMHGSHTRRNKLQTVKLSTQCALPS